MYVCMLEYMSAPLYVYVTHTQHTHTRTHTRTHNTHTTPEWIFHTTLLPPISFSKSGRNIRITRTNLHFRVRSQILLLCLDLFCTFVYVCACMYPCVLSVSWSVICCQDGCLTAFSKGALPEEYLKSQFWRAMLGRTLSLSGAFPALVGVHHWSLGTTFLGS